MGADVPLDRFSGLYNLASGRAGFLPVERPDPVKEARFSKKCDARQPYATTGLVGKLTIVVKMAMGPESLTARRPSPPSA